MVQSVFRATATLLCFALAGFAQQAEVAREWLVLSRIKEKMAQNLARLPNYTCLETIERSETAGPSRPLKRMDVLRLEVAQVGKEELFSWPGSSSFEEKDLGRLVGVGIVATGDFALHVRSIFQGLAPTFRYLGEEDLNGRRTLRYDYRISQLLSGYTIRSMGGQAVVPYHGSFWVDAASLELVRLDVHLDEIPPELGIASAGTSIYYAKTRIGDSDFLLPQSAELVLTRRSGASSRNRVEFTHCRQFRSESVVSFALEEVDPASAKPTGPTEVRLPAGLSFTVELQTVVDSEKSSVGDLIQAKVSEEVKQEQKVLAPRGALLTGRLRRLERVSRLPGYFVVGLEFSQLEFGNTRGRFFARLEETGALPGATRQLSSARIEARALPYGGRVETMTRQLIVDVELPGVGTVYIQESKFKLPRGFRMVWKTIEPARIKSP